MNKSFHLIISLLLITLFFPYNIYAHTYLPYGNVYEHLFSQNRYDYTGKELDEDTGLHYYGARYYNAKLGRFMSVDPGPMDIYYPETLNRYPYVLNNPFSFIDPDGRACTNPGTPLGTVNTCRFGLGGAIGGRGIGAGSGQLALPPPPPRPALSSPSISSRGLPPNANFAQRTFSQTFSPRGQDIFSNLANRQIRTIDYLANAIRSGNIKPQDVPVNVIARDGNILILNTRSVQALQRAGIPRTSFNIIDQTGVKRFERLLDRQLTRNNLNNTGFRNPTPRGR